MTTVLLSKRCIHKSVVIKIVYNEELSGYSRSLQVLRSITCKQKDILVYTETTYVYI